MSDVIGLFRRVILWRRKNSFLAEIFFCLTLAMPKNITYGFFLRMLWFINNMQSGTNLAKKMCAEKANTNFWAEKN
jgi:hypothetical protein